ncbi:MAG: ABC transporter ATP-binding protein [Burkholderiaceae bacterium]|nr:ABC transporter ATP-binding protein [Microbacteriaceae bacterium]
MTGPPPLAARDTLLTVSDLNVTYRGRGFRAPQFRALTDVSIDIGRGETVGLVGESGSGKTTLGRALLGLVPIDSGSVRFESAEIAGLSDGQRRRRSPDIQVVFQDPYSSLNPAMTVEAILSEPLTVRGVSRGHARRRVRELLDQVQLAAGAERRYPREFSGGQRQRIAIARALALEPKLIICDEPVSALDLSTQARVLDLFIEIQERTGVAYLFISHDISVVRYISHRVAVMLRGEIIESGDGESVTSSPEHDYTRRLLLASPVPDPLRQAERRARYLSLQ